MRHELSPQHPNTHTHVVRVFQFCYANRVAFTMSIRIYFHRNCAQPHDGKRREKECFPFLFPTDRNGRNFVFGTHVVVFESQWVNVKCQSWSKFLSKIKFNWHIWNWAKLQVQNVNCSRSFILEIIFFLLFHVVYIVSQVVLMLLCLMLIARHQITHPSTRPPSSSWSPVGTCHAMDGGGGWNDMPRNRNGNLLCA